MTFARDVARHFRWNFSVNLLDISFIVLGLGLVSRETVTPLVLWVREPRRRFAELSAPSA